MKNNQHAQKHKKKYPFVSQAKDIAADFTRQMYELQKKVESKKAKKSSETYA